MMSAARAGRARAIALEAGFDLAGVASAAPPPELAFFAQWISRGHAGEMAYLTGQQDRRSDLRAAFPWAKSVVSVGLQYDTPAPYSTDADAGRGWVARYAWGDDYHVVIEQRLDALFLATLSRYPQGDEQTAPLAALGAAAGDAERQQILGDVLWALMNCAEFTLNH